MSEYVTGINMQHAQVLSWESGVRTPFLQNKFGGCISILFKGIPARRIGNNVKYVFANLLLKQ